MKSIRDFADVKIGDITGALRHHRYFTSMKSRTEEIGNDARFITENGVSEYIKREYGGAGTKSKNIIINNIRGKLFITDGNRHCISMVIADKDVTIGKLLEYEPELFRYWEEGFEDGGDTSYQPYVTYIPIDTDVSHIPGARQGTDDKGARINIIPSDIAYDGDVFADEDKGKPIYITAHAIEVEQAYSASEPLIFKAETLPDVLGCCGKLYDAISRLNMKYGFVGRGSGYDHTLIWFIAERVRIMPIADAALSAHIEKFSVKELAELIFDSIDKWVRGEKNR